MHSGYDYEFAYNMREEYSCIMGKCSKAYLSVENEGLKEMALKNFQESKEKCDTFSSIIEKMYAEDSLERANERLSEIQTETQGMVVND